MSTEIKCLLLSVGGSMTPLRVTLETLHPQTAVFFVSRATRTLVQTELHPRIPHAFVCLRDDHDAETLDACITRLLEDIPSALRDLNLESLSWPDAVDFTGGTKVMSAALVWAALQHHIPMHYVGSRSAEGRDKSGVGRVCDGAELLKSQPHHHTLCHFELARAEAACSEHRFDLAATFADQAAAWLPPQESNVPLIRALALTLRALAHRDRFDFKTARQQLGQVQQHLGKIPRPATEGPPFLHHILHNIPKWLAECQALCESRTTTPVLLRELEQNARRRLDEHRWEDATARLYALLERLLQYRLSTQHQINPSSCRADELPDLLRSEYTRKYADPSGNLRFGCLAAAKLLHTLGDPLLSSAEELTTLEKLLLARNLSILAHGIQPVTEDDARNLASFLQPKLAAVL